MWQAVLLSWWLFGTLASCCPQYCRCFTDDDGYKVANCSKSGIISSDPAPTIDVLNFKNQVRGTQTKLEARIFKNFRGVKYLNLRNTSISQLPTDVFYGLSHVSRLDLSYNKIKHLNGVVFKGLPNLRYLSLRGNFLSISPLEVIVSETLQDLDMGFCSITNLPLYTFSSAPNIRQLILDGNFIQTIEYNVLPKGLTYLNLANNNIVKPPINVFNSLRRLIRLDISNNPINCSCSLLVFQDTLSGRAGMLENGVRCNNPSHLFGREISTVNENQLCRDDYMNREGLNGFVHLRTKKSHRHNNNQYNVQSDDQFMGDESYGQREAAEVMFTNDETNQMGTHMEARIQGSVSPNTYSETSADNKVTQNSEDIPTETQVSGAADDDQNGYPTSGNANEADQENHLTTKEDNPDRELLEDGHQSTGTENASVEEEHSTKLEEISETGGKSETEDNLVSPQTGGNHGSSNDESSSINNNINTISFDASSSSNDPTNSLHGSEPATQYTTNTDGMSSQSELTHDEPSLSPATMLMGNDHEERNSTASNTPDDDVDVLDLLSSQHENLSHLELEDDPFTTTEYSPSKEEDVIPSSPTEPSDYNYDAHHDYGTGDPATSSENSDDSPKPTEVTNDSASPSSTPETDIDDEGSGDYADRESTSSESNASPSSTVKFMEEQEPETESSSLRTVSDDLGDISTTDSLNPDAVSSSSTEAEIPTTYPPSSSTTDESSYLDQQTTEPTLVSSETPSTETSSPSSESSSSEPTATEIFAFETSSEPSSSSTPSESPTTSEQASTEQATVPSVSSSSPEPSSTQSETSTEASSSTAAISWELSSTIEPSSSTESSSKRGFWWDSEEELSSPSSSPSTVEPVQSSSKASVYKKPKMIEFTTERSTTEASEVEVWTKLVDGAHNENIVVDKNREEDEKTALISGVTYIIIGLLLALVLILLTVVACRRKSPTKVRLPVDPETAAGTEMQDMLLPKASSGNGVKVGRPNTYTNGSAAPITNGKPKLENVLIQDPEETVPVLLADPEQEPEPPEPEIAWDDKPEPIEAVTARLTMLARPQTPIFIQKPPA
ncbi:Hypothetical protein NTJ_05337 [Nesidiocoris tenuis]|nr:Hypothetical protein NTJ_05337 [Nesidiocoris tenuis]